MPSSPTSNKNELYILVGNYGTIPLTDLLQQAIDHFGPCELADLTISPEWWQVTGCSCHPEYSDHENYICVTLE